MLDFCTEATSSEPGLRGEALSWLVVGFSQGTLLGKGYGPTWSKLGQRFEKSDPNFFNTTNKIGQRDIYLLVYLLNENCCG